MDGPIRLVTICGSLRAGSWNRRLLDLAASMAPDGWETTTAEIGGLPLFDQDLEDSGASPEVERLRAQVGGADAVLVATPQYNLGISGVLKNAIDWLSRPAFAGVLAGMPVTVIGSTPGRHTPEEAVGQALTALEICAARVLRPGLSLTSISRGIDEAGSFTNDVTAPLAELMERFARFVGEVRAEDEQPGGAP